VIKKVRGPFSWTAALLPASGARSDAQWQVEPLREGGLALLIGDPVWDGLILCGMWGALISPCVSWVHWLDGGMAGFVSGCTGVRLWRGGLGIVEEVNGRWVRRAALDS